MPSRPSTGAPRSNASRVRASGALRPLPSEPAPLPDAALPGGADGVAPDAPERAAEAAGGAEQQGQAAPRGGRSARAGLVMASGTIVSRVLGMVRTIMLAAAIGVTGQVTDLWDLANVLPNQIYGTIAGGVFSAILVPLIVKAARAEDRGSDYLSRLMTLLVSFLLVITVAFTLATPWIIGVLGSHYNPDQKAVAIQLTYFLLPQIFFYGLYAILGQVLNAYESYGPFMWSPVLNNLIAMATLGLFMWLYGPEASQPHLLKDWGFDKTLVLGLGTTLGIVAQAVVLWLPLRKLRLGLRPDFRFKGVGLREAAKLAGWTSAAMVMGNIPLFIYNYVEVSITRYRQDLNDPTHVVAGPGALSSAALVTALPHAVLAVSLATILVTRMSQAAAGENMPRLKEILNHGLRVLGLPMVIASSMIIVLAGPLGLVFAASQPRAGALIGVAIILLIVSAPVFSASVFLNRTLYTLGDAKTPFLIVTALFVYSLVMAVLAYLVHPEVRIFYFALTTTVGNVITFCLSHWALNRRIGSYGFRSVFDIWVKYTWAAALASGLGAVVLWLLGGYSQSGFAWRGMFPALIVCTAVAAAMGTVYLGVLKLMRVRELEDFIGPFLRKLGR